MTEEQHEKFVELPIHALSFNLLLTWFNVVFATREHPFTVMSNYVALGWEFSMSRGTQPGHYLIDVVNPHGVCVGSCYASEGLNAARQAVLTAAQCNHRETFSLETDRLNLETAVKTLRRRGYDAEAAYVEAVLRHDFCD